MGNLLNLSIARPDGVQNIVLSSGYGREFGTVYGGDGDIRSAAKLLEFLNHRLPEEKDGKLDNSARNECTALPCDLGRNHKTTQNPPPQPSRGSQ